MMFLASGTGHSITKCSCGVVIMQCRCPGPKTERTLPHPACEQGLQARPSATVAREPEST